METSNNNNSNDNNDINTLVFSTIVNNSTHTYGKFKEAEAELHFAQRELKRSKSEINSHPINFELSSKRLSGAQKSYDNAKKLHHEASTTLNNLLFGLGTAQVKSKSEASGPSSISNNQNIQDICRKQTDQAISQVRKEFEKLLNGVKRDIEERDQRHQIKLKNLIEEQTKERDGFHKRDRQQRQEFDKINQRLSHAESTIKEIRQSLTLLSKSQKQNETTQSILKDISDLNGKAVRLDESFNNLHGALGRAQEAFTQIYNRLDKVETKNDHQPAIDSMDQASIETIKSRLDTLDQSIDKLKSSESIHALDMSGVDTRNPIIHSLSDVSPYIKVMAADITAKQETAITTMEDCQKFHESITTHLRANVNELRIDLDALATRVNVEITSDKTVPSETDLQNLQTKILTLENRNHDLTNQIRGFGMATKHLGEQMKQFSTDEIVAQINMSMRNVSNKSLTTLGQQIQNLIKDVDRLKIDRQLDPGSTIINQQYLQQG